MQAQGLEFSAEHLAEKRRQNAEYMRKYRAKLRMRREQAIKGRNAVIPEKNAPAVAKQPSAAVSRNELMAERLQTYPLRLPELYDRRLIAARWPALANGIPPPEKPEAPRSMSGTVVSGLAGPDPRQCPPSGKADAWMNAARAGEEHDKLKDYRGYDDPPLEPGNV
jgi:hypothetical protein